MSMHPGRFDVIVTDNHFGDIISDLGATIQGELGVASSANLNLDGHSPSMLGPIHGPARDIAGRAVGRIPPQPSSRQLSALPPVEKGEAALSLERAAASVLAELPALSGSAMDTITDALDDQMARQLAEVGSFVNDARGSSIMTATAAE
ncbi:isocitrate/isopropylmalate family dehydrogenase [Paeniglutamicibacter cryotolerans]|uniref:Isocitrate/isopropylmalate dehydrogenase n=2 Tax=Paeniglutamicibacter cryotolerans TaxID=670079 RepID=A0A839QU97_9MICC|nr:isocitrate/isopropylmalate family dehydrogenase [Paeniglutamicibacter cryotolerans]MBB2996842.1 isocitrate/isopropylmalate dehydrogenase [Paeniglutamicibacter cryotolerans]